MLLIIKGKLSLTQYFLTMLISTVCLVAVVAASYLLPHNKDIVALLVMVLSLISLGSSGQIISATLGKKDY